MNELQKGLSKFVGYLKGGDQRFASSQLYWEQRYAEGGTSGQGSYGKFADFKADTLNEFVAHRQIESVIEFGCGDGNQLSLSKYPSYVGLDVSPTAIRTCISRFASDSTKSFFLYDPLCFCDQRSVFSADLALSLDVVHHLVEDRIFELYFQHLFASANRYVIIYSTNDDLPRQRRAPHVRHRRFTPLVEARFPDWLLTETIESTPLLREAVRPELIATFHVYEQRLQGEATP